MRTAILALFSLALFVRESLVAGGPIKTEEIEDRHFESILDGLDSPLTKSKAKDEAATKLQRLGTNALPLLLKEVRRLGGMESTNVISGTELKMKLQAAFEVLGPKAMPLLPDLVAEMDAGRSLGVVPFAIAQIGGPNAGLALVKAITNSNPQVRASGATSLAYFKSNPKIAAAAVGPLVRLMDDASGVLRATAANTLGLLPTEPDIAIRALVRAAESDKDSVVRAAAIRSIGRFGILAVSARERLNKIAQTDQDADVRRMAAETLHAIESKAGNK